MYFQPYGDEQQLNLNWIINEIINLHKQLDPDYETPSFTQVYPYSNLNRLNLDWILSELKALKELAPTPTPPLDIQAVAEALVALPFDSTKSYQIYDYISRDGEIWRAIESISAGGEWDETKWFKTKLGTDLAVLDRWINAINADLTTLQNTVEDLSSSDISDDSDAGGATVKESLNNLKGSLNTLDAEITNILTPTATNITITKNPNIANGDLDMNVGSVVGNIVNASGRLYNISEPANGNFFQIPAGYYPKKTTRGFGYMIVDNVNIPLLAVVNTDGTVYLGHSPSKTTTQVGFIATYPIDY